MARSSKVHFRPAPELSLIHAAFVVATGGLCSDERLESSLRGPTSEINTRLLSSMADTQLFWSHLFASVAAGQTPRDCCAAAFIAAGGSELQAEQSAAGLASLLDDCRITFNGRFPKLADQLKLRSGPLRDRWQTFGPGLLIQTAGRIWGSKPPEEWWPEDVNCLLLQPLRGGDGGFDSGGQRVWMEAVLTDVDPQVSEVLRLAYWVTQVAVGRHLDSTLGRVEDGSHPEDFGSGTHRRTTLPWRLGCVPLVLEAARELEVLSARELPIEAALRLWRLGDAKTAALVSDWWQTWRGLEDPIPVALKALEVILDRDQKRRAAISPEA
ncbi:MAG: hypothetical protein AAF802_13735 [Planctomycetota bacterium]